MEKEEEKNRFNFQMPLIICYLTFQLFQKEKKRKLETGTGNRLTVSVKYSITKLSTKSTVSCTGAFSPLKPYIIGTTVMQHPTKK